MCKYKFHRHKEPFVCFECRKSYRQTSRWSLPYNRRLEPGQERKVSCPQCNNPMADMGPFFKAPKQKDTKRWMRIKQLWLEGFNNYECECCGLNLDDEIQDDVEAFIKGKLSKTEIKNLFAIIGKKPK
jgi:hypothetical protein